MRFTSQRISRCRIWRRDLTLGPYGLWFNRNETWAEEAKPWVTYLARCSYLLQQGHYYADVAYFYGEEGPLTAVFGWKPIEDAPDGYGFDFVNSDVVLHELSVKRWAAGDSRRHELSDSLSGRAKPAHDAAGVAQDRLTWLQQGAVLVGNRPTDSPSLADDEKELQRVADQLWGKHGCSAIERKVGKGRVYAGMSANEALAELGVARDFEYTKPEPDATLMFCIVSSAMETYISSIIARTAPRTWKRHSVWMGGRRSFGMLRQA